MHTLVVILLAVAVMVLGAQSPKPLGWVGILFAVVALLAELTPRLLQ